MKEWKDWMCVLLLIENVALIVFSAWLLLTYAGGMYQGQVVTYEKMMGAAKEVSHNMDAVKAYKK